MKQDKKMKQGIKVAAGIKADPAPKPVGPRPTPPPSQNRIRRIYNQLGGSGGRPIGGGNYLWGGPRFW